MNLVFLGPPGSGKGTQSCLLESKYGLKKISTGDMLRSAVDQDDQLKAELSKIIASGNLIPDELIVEMVKKNIKEVNWCKGVIFDGFPRTTSQATSLDKILSDENQTIDVVLRLKIPDSFLVQRIMGRYICANCSVSYNKFFKPTKAEGVCDNCGSKNLTFRKDDNIESIETRLKAYHQSTELLIEYYTKKKIIEDIDGTTEVDIISQQINSILQKHVKILT